jgi:hypothetical protein
MNNNFEGFDIVDEDLTENIMSDEDWLKSLPQPDSDKNEFIVEVEWEDLTIYANLRELYWHEMMDIEAFSFRKKDEEEYYLAGENERREILRKALQWVAVVPNQEFDSNEDRMLLKRIKFEVVEAIWEEYQPRIYLGATEASALYNASVKYFNGEAQTSSPVPSIIVEVDMMLKFGGLNRSELRKITTTEMERMQIVFMARSEALGLGPRRTRVSSPRPEETDAEDMQDWASTLPPHANENNPGFLTGFG